MKKVSNFIIAYIGVVYSGYLIVLIPLNAVISVNNFMVTGDFLTVIGLFLQNSFSVSNKIHIHSLKTFFHAPDNFNSYPSDLLFGKN